MEGLSIVVPVYNEENAVLPTIDQVNRIMTESTIPYELIIVNDGSSDQTGEILKEYQKKSTFRLIDHAINSGYGAALKTGIRNAKFDKIAITDADATYPNERIPEFYHEVEHFHMIVGKREFRKLPFFTRPAKWFITKLANYLADYKIPDINSGLRVFRKKDAMKFFHIIPSGFSFTTTITLAMLTNDMQIKYIPIQYMKREGKSKIKPLYDTMNFIQLIVRTIMYFNPLKVFIPLSLFLIVLSFIVLAYSYFALPRVMDVSTAILFISGVLMLAIGMLADLIDKRMHINDGDTG